MAITLRRARSRNADIELFQYLCLATPPDIRNWKSPKEIPRRTAVRAIEHFTTYFISKDGTPVGLITLDHKSADELYIEEVGIIPKYWGKGIGTLALKRVLKPLLKTKRIWLVTHPTNSRAIRLYLKLGFEIQGWKANYFSDGEPRLVLDLVDRKKMRA